MLPPIVLPLKTPTSDGDAEAACAACKCSATKPRAQPGLAAHIAYGCCDADLQESRSRTKFLSEARLQNEIAPENV